MTPPFPRTTCDCAECVDACKRQPGYLIPGDLERIAAFLGETMASVQRFFWSSEGALLGDLSTGRQFRLRTITPRYDRRTKACVFLDETGHCRIHPVAPFGCAYFDTHMSNAFAQPRSVWGMTLVRDNPTYTEQRKDLPFADHYKPLGY